MLQLKDYLSKNNIWLILFCHVLIIISLYFNLVWFLIPVIFLYTLFIVKKIRYYWWSIVSIILLIVIYMLFYDIGNYFSGYIIKNQDGIVIDVNSTYVIVKIKNMFLYMKVPFGVKFYIDQHIKISGKLVNLEINNYYSFNFTKYLNLKNVFFKLDISKIEICDSKSIRYSFWKWISNSNLSDLFLIFISQEYLKNNVIYNDLKNLGLAFILNFSSLYGYILIWILSRIKKSKIRITINFTIIFILIFYAYLINFPLSFIRFLSMFLILSFSKLIKKKILTNKIFCTSIIFSLVFKPLYLFSTGWIYILIAFLAFNYWYKSENKSYFKLWIFSLFVFSPLEAYFNHSINFMTEFLYILLLPIFAILGMISLFFSLAHINEGSIWLSDTVGSSLELIGKIKLIINIGNINLFFIVLFYIFLFLLIKKNPHLQIKTIIYGFWIFVFSGIIILNGFLTSKISLNMLNVGNGNSFILENDKYNYSLIFDAGVGKGKNKSTLSDFIKYKGINYVKYIFLSHSDSDHVNSLSQVKQGVLIGKIYGPDPLKNIHIKYKDAEIWSFNIFTNKTVENEECNIFYIKINDIGLLFMGDSTVKTEFLLLNNPFFKSVIDKVDYYQVGHHGSKTSTSYQFLEFIKPRNCLISGEDKGNLHFPDLDVVERLKAIGCKINITNGVNNFSYLIN